MIDLLKKICWKEFNKETNKNQTRLKVMKKNTHKEISKTVEENLILKKKLQKIFVYIKKICKKMTF